MWEPDKSVAKKVLRIRSKINKRRANVQNDSNMKNPRF